MLLPGWYVTQAAVTKSALPPIRSTNATLTNSSKRHGSSLNGATDANVCGVKAARRAPRASVSSVRAA